MTNIHTPAAETPAKQSLMRRVHKLETGYLNVLRVALAAVIVLGVLAVAGAAGWYLYVHLATAGERKATDYLEPPDWEAVRPSVLPTFTAAPASAADRAVTGDAAPDGRQGIDQRVLRIAEQLNAQFTRSAGDEAGFTDRYPRRLLESWILEESVPAVYLDEYIEELVAVSKEIGEDGRINRIGALDDRAQVIMNALRAFNEAYLANIAAAERRVAAERAAVVARRTEAASLGLLLGLGGLGLLVSIMLIVVLLRIEAHLHDQVRLRSPVHEKPR